MSPFAMSNSPWRLFLRYSIPDVWANRTQLNGLGLGGLLDGLLGGLGLNKVLSGLGLGEVVGSLTGKKK